MKRCPDPGPAGAPAWAVQPDEVLDDPALEQRAREISEGLRCPVCRNESIDESNAGISKDLRVKLRERLVAGDSDEEAVQYLVDRYGEFILFSPPKEGANLVLWLAGPVFCSSLPGSATPPCAPGRPPRPPKPCRRTNRRGWTRSCAPDAGFRLF